MKKINIIIILSILVMAIAFLLGFSIAKSKDDKDINQNINTITIGSQEKAKNKIDINTADKSELMSIKGIGDKKADLIIAYRPYNSIWDLSNVNGISEEFIKTIESEVTT